MLGTFIIRLFQDGRKMYHIYGTDLFFNNSLILLTNCFYRAEECKKDNSTITSSRSNFKKNPRQPGLFPFELLQFAFDKSYFERLKKYEHNDANNSYSKHLVEDELLLSYAVSEIKTRIMQELISLINADMINVTNGGFLAIKSGWETKVHSFVLNDMYETGWGIDIDTKNKFCLHSSIREKLNTSWKRTTDGWIDKLGNKCHSHNDFELQKTLFEQSFEDQMNDAVGIAQFGI